MQDERNSGSDDDEQYTEADRSRISELFPRDLTHLFAPSPKPAYNVPHDKPLAVAGSDDRCDVSLERMQVVMRIRPPLHQGVPSWSKENCIHAMSGSTVAIAPPESSQGYRNGDRGQTYNFTRVFSENTSQQEYFQATAAPLVRHLVQEQQAAAVLMAYGISAAGKTYTIEGTRSEPGVLPRALELLFQEVKDSPEELTVHVSQFEVYNEQIYDLLAEDTGAVLGQRPALRLKEDSQGRIFVRGLSEAAVGSGIAAMEMQRKGARQRQKAATALNYHSSRSHSVFTVALYRASGSGLGEDESGRVGRLSFVDLAGSERANRTGNVGARLKESVAINASLMTLGRCLEALRWNQQHRAAEPKLVPYRESKVTHLFRDVLHGWGQIMLSVNVSPCAKDYDETSHVLKYASLATQIGTAARAEAPVRALKAISPNITKKRLPKPEPVPSNLGPVKKLKKVGGPQAMQASQAASAEAAVALNSGTDQSKQEGGSTSSSSSSSSDDAEDEQMPEMVQELEEEVRRLHDQLVAAEERCALAETEIREEVSTEMASLLHDMEANYKERLASEVAAVEKRKYGGGKSGKAAAVAVRSSYCQTDTDGSAADLQNIPQQGATNDAELNMMRAKLQNQALELAHEPELTAAHSALISLSQAAESDHAKEKLALSRQLKQSQRELTATQLQCKELIEQLQILAETQQRQLTDNSEHLLSLTQQVTAAQTALAAQASLQSELQSMIERCEAAQCQFSQLESAHTKATQQLSEAQTRNSYLEQMHAKLSLLAHNSLQHTLPPYPCGAPADPVAALEHVVSVLHIRAVEAETTVDKLTQQVQSKEAAHESEIEHLRAEVQQAQVYSQSAQPQAAQVLRQSLERELKQQVTQLEANSQMELEMLQQQLESSKKESTSLKRRLEAATAAMACANISSANPALLRVMQAGAKGGPHRGAGGTPHALALAWAREEAARLSPAIPMASTSKTPCPGVATAEASPNPSLARFFPMSPHPHCLSMPAQTSAMKQRHCTAQQLSVPLAVLPAAAAESGSAAQTTQWQADSLQVEAADSAAPETEAQWESDPTAMQAASQMSLLQAEQTQAELTLAGRAQSGCKGQSDTHLMSRLRHSRHPAQQPNQGAVLIPSTGRHSHQAAQEEAATTAGDASIWCQSSARGKQNDMSSLGKPEPQLPKSSAHASQSEPLRSIHHSLSQPERPHTRRQTRSSARASSTAQKGASEVISSGHGRRGKAQTGSAPALPAVMEHTEADSAVGMSELPVLPSVRDGASTEQQEADSPTAELAGRSLQQKAVLATLPELAMPEHQGPVTQEPITGLQSCCLAGLLSKVPQTGAELHSSVANDGDAAWQPLAPQKHPSALPLSNMQISLATVPMVGDTASCCAEPHSTHHGNDSEHTTVFEPDAEQPAMCVSGQGTCSSDPVAPSGDAAADPSGSHPPAAEAAEEAALPEGQLPMQLCGRDGSVEADVNQDASSRQGQKQGGRAKRPPKPKHPAMKKQTRKRGKPGVQQDENADDNTAPVDMSRAMAKPDVDAAADHVVACPEQLHRHGPTEVDEEAVVAQRQDGSKKPRDQRRPKRRKLQPATPMSRCVQEALGEFVADDSHFMQHMKQTPVALRTRRATRFGAL